jgi:hypothetical protein
MSVLRAWADVDNPRSLSNRMRSRRFSRFEQLCAGLSRPLRIIDIGGTQEFWEHRGWAGLAGVDITLVNLSATRARHDNIRAVVGDATNLSEFADDEFDVAFSNSVIEHLFTWARQQAMASEVRRVGQAHWVQTPNVWFPIEPHFHVPAWQWMPRSMRAAIIQRWMCGQRGPYPDPDQARAAVAEVRLLSGRELARLFPESTIWPERIWWGGGLVKSWVAIGGFPAAGPSGDET